MYLEQSQDEFVENVIAWEIFRKIKMKSVNFINSKQFYDLEFLFLKFKIKCPQM